MSLVFVGGIHGAGKSTLAAEIARLTGAHHSSAGRIIQAAQKSKLVDDVDANQRVLIDAIDRLRQLHERLVIDGHFAVITPNGIAPIQIEVFRELRPSAVIVLLISVDTAAERLFQRDGREYDLRTLADLQNFELAAARATASVLNVPILELSEKPDAAYAATWLKSHLV